MQNDAPHFPNAPIVEAVIGIDLSEALSDDSLQTLSELATGFEPEYPIREAIYVGHLVAEFGKQPTQVDAQMGFYCKSADGRQVIHIRLDGFAFSRLTPYENWEHFSIEAKRTWAAYRSAIGMASLNRFNVRYINKLSLPKSAQLEDYLNVYPHIPNSFPQALSGCFMQLGYPLRDPYQGLLTQRLFAAPSEDPDLITFILDHDFSYATIGLSDSEMWEGVMKCRNIKNTFFLDALTSKMKESFE